MYLIIYIFILIPKCTGFCESKLLINNATDTEFLSEIGNSITSLSYSIFGIIGAFNELNTVLYYIVMNLIFLMGLMSFLHHYFYTNNKWAYIADITCMEMLVSMSLIYMIANNSAVYLNNIQKLLILVTLTNTIAMFIYNILNVKTRFILFATNLGCIVLYQKYIILFFYKNNKNIFKHILKSELVNGCVFGLSVGCWYLDNLCYPRVHVIINAHALWHVFSGLALFNCINLSSIYYAYNNHIEYKWKPLFRKLPYLFFIIKLTKLKSNVRHNYTNINLEDIRLIDTYNHRRTKSAG